MLLVLVVVASIDLAFFFVSRATGPTSPVSRETILRAGGRYGAFTLQASPEQLAEQLPPLQAWGHPPPLHASSSIASRKS